MLEIKDLQVHYGKARALENVSLNIQEGEIVSIVGANGAGKTTILRAVSGLKKPTSGQIFFNDTRIDGLASHKIVQRGIVQIPAGRMIIGPMTVLDNLKIGAYRRKDKANIKADLEKIYASFPILEKRQSQPGGQLSGGEQQMLAVARALMAKPRLLLMDEPSIGLSPIMVTEVANIIRNINRDGISILLVEQNCRMALNLSQRAYILELGSIGLEGDSKSLAEDERVKRIYLGG